MKYVSLFAGIGGFDLALNRLGHKCVYANEWDKYAAEIYNKNSQSISEVKQDGEGGNRASDKGRSDSIRTGYSEPTGNRVDTRDITTVPTSEIPDHDLLVGGFPCQAFSIAGKRRGFDDTRGTLFFEIARILKDKKPRYFILENVKGLLSHDNGFTFKTIIATLTELGYDLQWQVLNSKDFGVPQNRERVFIVGHLRGEPRPKVFPITESNTEYIQPDAQGNYIAHTLQTGDKHRGSYIRTDEPNTQEGRDKPNDTNTIRRTSYTDGMRIRRLTPTECERLQGFPDGWTEGVSDTQRYKCLGNAVTVNVVYEVARRL
jgi:DNA (cytosine-5)-methyltransferase 1